MKSLKYIRHWLWPHAGNRYRPHLTRPLGVGMVAAALMVIQLSYNFLAAGKPQILGYATDIRKSVIYEASNEHRLREGLGKLTVNAQLEAAALAKARHMMNQGYWGHTAPDGTEPWSFMVSAGYSYQHAGENLAKSFATSEGVVAGWMKSPGHRRNLLAQHFSETGIAVLNGTLGGEKTTLVVAMYASPARVQTTLQPQVYAASNEQVQYGLIRPLALSTAGWGALAGSGSLLLLVWAFLSHHLVWIRHKKTKSQKIDKARFSLGLALGLLVLSGLIIINSFGSVI